MPIRVVKAALLLTLLLTAFSCTRHEEPKGSTTVPGKNVRQQGTGAGAGVLSMAVGGLLAPRESYAYYKEFADYLGEKLNRRVQLVIRDTQDEINHLVTAAQVDIAFICGCPYDEGERECRMDLVVAPQVNGETVYYSYIIVHKDSPMRRFEDLRGRRFVFTDPSSITGNLVPTSMLAQMNETPSTFFRKISYSKTHDKAIKAVALGIADGAAVDSIIWEYENRKNPEFTSKTRIIEKSPSFGIPPVVVRNGMDPALRTQIRQIFLDAHLDPAGRKILTGMMIDRFVTVDERTYDSIRELERRIVRQKTPKGKPARPSA